MPLSLRTFSALAAVGLLVDLVTFLCIGNEWTLLTICGVSARTLLDLALICAPLWRSRVCWNVCFTIYTCGVGLRALSLGTMALGSAKHAPPWAIPLTGTHFLIAAASLVLLTRLSAIAYMRSPLDGR